MGSFDKRQQPKPDSFDCAASHRNHGATILLKDLQGPSSTIRVCSSRLGIEDCRRIRPAQQAGSLACPAYSVQDSSCCSSTSHSRRKGPQASFRRQCLDSTTCPCRCARRIPHEARLRACLEGRRFLGAPTANLRLQARPCQVDPSRPCPDQTATYPCWQADRQCPQLHRPTGQPKAHRLRPDESLWWWSSWSC